MDVDEPQPTRNSPFIHYFDVSDAFPWQEPRPDQIRLRRASMDDTLIFDILLTSGGVGDTYVLYPPESPETLQQLLDAIECSSYDSLKKDCLVYFLLKWHQDGRERTFQEQRCIPPQFVALADAYWHLDTGINVPRAVALLSDARLNRDYASKIIHAISLSPEAAPLIRRYVQTAKPSLVEPLDLEYYALALADHSVLDAWSFTRTFNETDPTRTRLLRKLFEWIISPQPRPIALKQLITLPLSPFEEKIVCEFVQKPPNDIAFSSVAILQDLICVRLIQGGRYTEAIKLDRLFTSTTHQKHLIDTHDRSSMVQDVYNALPAVEKALLDLELNPAPLHQQQPILSKPVSTPQSTRKATAEDPTVSLSQSWEEVRVPESLVQKSTPLRDVQLPRGGATPSSALPIFPVRLHGASGATPRKNLPGVASVPLSSARPAPQQPRVSLSGVGSRMLFGTPNAVASPASGIKLPPGPNFGSSHGPSPSFVSASRQRNAFYQPPVKSNGVKRAFEDESRMSPDHDDDRVSPDGGMEPEGGDKSYEEESTRRQVRRPAVEESDEEDNALQYSLFGAKNESPKRSVGPSKKKLGGQDHGSYRIEDEDEEMEIYERPEREEKKPSKTRSGRTTRATQPKATATAAHNKPPAKKAKQIKDVVRHIPGGLMEETDDDEEEEHEDQITALPTTRNPRNTSRAGAVKGKRKTTSVDNLTDDMEVGVQTRRRSSRLTAASSSGSMRGISPEPVAAAPKTRRAAGRTSTASKKKR